MQHTLKNLASGSFVVNREQLETNATRGLVEDLRCSIAINLIINDLNVF